MLVVDYVKKGTNPSDYRIELCFSDTIVDITTAGKRKVASQEIHDLEGLRKLYANVSFCA